MQRQQLRHNCPQPIEICPVASPDEVVPARPYSRRAQAALRQRLEQLKSLVLKSQCPFSQSLSCCVALGRSSAETINFMRLPSNRSSSFASATKSAGGAVIT